MFKQNEIHGDAEKENESPHTGIALVTNCDQQKYSIRNK